MRKCRMLMIVGFAVILAAGLFAAQRTQGAQARPRRQGQHAKARQAQTPPAPNATVAKLRTLDGRWTGTAQITETGKDPVSASVEMFCRDAAGGSAVLCHGRFASKEMDYRETDLFGYDAESGKVHWYAVTNAGEVHDHVGGFDGNTLSVKYEGTMQGKPMVEKITVDFGTDGVMSFHSDTTVDGAAAATMTGTVKKE